MWQNGCATLAFISARRFRPLGVANCFVPRHIHTHVGMCVCVGVWLRLQPNNSCFNLHIWLAVVYRALIPISCEKSKCATPTMYELKGNTLKKKCKSITDRISNCIINFALLLQLSAQHSATQQQQQRSIMLEKKQVAILSFAK